MTRRIDVVRSWVRTAAEGAGRGLRRIVPLHGFKELARDLRLRRIAIPTSRIGSALAHAPEMRSVAVVAGEGRLHVDAVFKDGDALQVAFVPFGVRFAPRGAKELVFRVDPPESTGRMRTLLLASALAGEIAAELYRPALGGSEPEDPSGAIVDREGNDRLRIDLRTVPAVRRAGSASPLAIMMELLEVSAIQVEGDAVRMELKLPRL